MSESKASNLLSHTKVLCLPDSVNIHKCYLDCQVRKNNEAIVSIPKTDKASMFSSGIIFKRRKKINTGLKKDSGHVPGEMRK